jgi:molybdenum cofactor cytidylyltransferase
VAWFTLPVTVLGVLLAAGVGSRYDGPTHKLLADLHGRPVVSHAIAALTAAQLDEAAIVTGAVDLGPLVPPELTVLANPHWSRGQGSSLAVAIEYARRRGHDRLVVALGDQPFVTAEAWRRLAASDAELAMADYRGRRGHPIALAATAWDRLDLSGDSGARALLEGAGTAVVAIPCPGNPADIDTVGDLARWTSSTNSQ